MVGRKHSNQIEFGGFYFYILYRVVNINIEKYL